MNDALEFGWSDEKPTDAHGYLMPAVMRSLHRIFATRSDRRLFDLGCGNGSVANTLSTEGWDVTGVDPSADGVAKANECFPEIRLMVGSAYDDLQSLYGQFPCVISLEVVEHVYAPRMYAKTLFSLVEPGGTAIVSTPYHGYWKNLALAATGNLDKHFTALWDHGHIKFWSVRTLSILLRDVGFRELECHRVGRIPPLAKSMIVEARRPLDRDGHVEQS